MTAFVLNRLFVLCGDQKGNVVLCAVGRAVTHIHAHTHTNTHTIEIYKITIGPASCTACARVVRKAATTHTTPEEQCDCIHVHTFMQNGSEYCPDCV